MHYTLLLIHSPLVGPYSWRPVADDLERLGQRTLIPSLLPVLDESSEFADAIAQRVQEVIGRHALSEPFFIVTHSAAGAYVPVIAMTLSRQISGYIFIDARLPARGASLADQDPPEAEAHRKRIATGGMLPSWSEWLREEAMAEAIPHAERRHRFTAELRPIPLALFIETITYPSDWPDAPCGYLRLSEFYAPLEVESSERGWLTMTIDAEPLHPVTHLQEVAGAILELIDSPEAL